MLIRKPEPLTTNDDMPFQKKEEDVCSLDKATQHRRQSRGSQSQGLRLNPRHTATLPRCDFELCPQCAKWGQQNHEEEEKLALDSRWTQSPGSVPSRLRCLTFVGFDVFICEIGTIEAPILWFIALNEIIHINFSGCDCLLVTPITLTIILLPCIPFHVEIARKFLSQSPWGSHNQGQLPSGQDPMKNENVEARVQRTGENAAKGIKI